MASEFSTVGILDGWTKGDLPGSQMVQVVLTPISTTSDGRAVLTAQLATDDEVDFAINKLIEGLESARRRAKDNIRTTNSRIRTALKASNESPDE